MSPSYIFYQTINLLNPRAVLLIHLGPVHLSVDKYLWKWKGDTKYDVGRLKGSFLHVNFFWL